MATGARVEPQDWPSAAGAVAQSAAATMMGIMGRISTSAWEFPAAFGTGSGEVISDAGWNSCLREDTRRT
jgi:hypothetical protein